ncbi:MAG: DUF2891 domain-containing protein [Winogradskyella arenosi]
MKKHFILLAILMAFSCKDAENAKENTDRVEEKIEAVEVVELNLEQANRLAQLPLNCINTEYPNKLSQTIGSASDLKTPQELHPAFYGCFDWHSAVHGHWSLVSLLKQFLDLDQKDVITQKLLRNISEEHIAQELLYFEGPHNKSFERTYGWAWLLKLAQELREWDAPTARQLEANLQPMTDLIVNKYLEFLPKLNYPIRVGEHPNTAFGLSFAYDYAVAVQHKELMHLIENRAKDFYKNDQNCPIEWEPSGYDFLSPCLEEAALMKRVLPAGDFELWARKFIPQLFDKDFKLPVGEVSDRTDGKLVHLDGVNFSRAWSLNYLAKEMPALKHLTNVANQHINYSLPNIVGDHYEGGHWLGSFAIYALNSTK